MFFSKKSQKDHQEDEAVAKKGIKKMDAMITGAILGGVVASLYGVKKLKDSRDQKNLEKMDQLDEKITEINQKIDEKTVIVEEKK